MLARSPLLELLILNNKFEKLTSAGKLHNQIKVFVRLDDLVNLHNIRVVQLLENLDFTADSLDVLFVFDLRFLENFNSDLDKKYAQRMLKRSSIQI